MRIEKLLPPTPPAKTWTVALEGGKTLRVTESTVLDQGLFAGLELDEAAKETLRGHLMDLRSAQADQRAAADYIAVIRDEGLRRRAADGDDLLLAAQQRLLKKKAYMEENT